MSEALKLAMTMAKKEVILPTPVVNKDRVFRITTATDYGYGRGWEYPKRFLYDSEKAYNIQLKTKNTQNIDLHKFRRNSKVRILCEEFINNNWVVLEERIYG